MLRKATPEDFAAWKSIYMQASVNPFMVYGSMSELNAAFLDLTQKSTLYVFENEEDKDIVGICRLTPSSGDSMHVIEINSFAISEKYRGKGYANSMLQAIMEEIAKQTEIIRVQLGVEGDNPVAQHLYTKAGFKLEASYDDWYRRYEGTHKEKWFVSENFMVKLLHVCDIKPLTSSHPITRFVDISKCDLRKATSLDVEKTYNLYQKRQTSLGLKVKSPEEFSADFIELLSNGTLYIYEAEQDIVSLCHLSPYTQYERLKHNAEIDFIIVDPSCSLEITGSLLESIIKDQKKNGIKRLEMTLLEGDEHLIEGCKRAGFKAKGKFIGAVKHPHGHYINKTIFENSLFDLVDAIEFVKTCHFDSGDEKKIIKKLEVITKSSFNDLKDIEYENSIYQTIKGFGNNSKEILEFISTIKTSDRNSFFSSKKSTVEALNGNLFTETPSR